MCYVFIRGGASASDSSNGVDGTNKKIGVNLITCLQTE